MIRWICGVKLTDTFTRNVSRETIETGDIIEVIHRKKYDMLWIKERKRKVEIDCAKIHALRRMWRV